MKIAAILVCLGCYLADQADAQGFINLDFEQASIQPVYDDGFFATLEWDLAAPGWGHSEVPDAAYVSYRNTHLGTGQRYLLVDSQSPSPQTGLGALEGTYSFYLAGGGVTPPGGGETEYVNAYLTQTGTVPSDARSIRLLAQGVCRVFLNGSEVSLISLGGDSYGGDVSAFAGSAAELKIMDASRPIAEEIFVGVTVDGIEFSPIAVPEPSAMALSCLAGLVLGTVAFRRTRAEPIVGPNGAPHRR